MIKSILLLTLPAVLISLLGGEIALRVWWGDRPTNGGGAPARAWARHYVQKNKLGLRGNLPAPEKPAGEYRIVALGDSVTFGKGIEKEEDRYPEVLGELLSKRLNVRVQAVNLGVLAFNTVEERDMLKKNGLGLNPDLVILGYSHNDPESVMQRLEITGKSRGSGILQLLTMNFYIADFAYRLYSRPRNINRYTEYLNNICATDAPNMPEFKNALRGIRDDCRANNADFAVVIFPTLYALDKEPYIFQPANDMITGELEALGVPYADLLPLLLGRDAVKLWVSRHDSHPDESVHEMAAKELLKLVEPMLEKSL